MKVALRFVARRVTPDNTCSAIYDVSMVLLQLQTSAAWTEVVALLWWHSGTVLTSLDLLLILDISRGATPIVVLCGNLSIDQLKFCVSCLRCYWYEPHFSVTDHNPYNGIVAPAHQLLRVRGLDRQELLNWMAQSTQ